jgi:hypothetical protein
MTTQPDKLLALDLTAMRTDYESKTALAAMAATYGVSRNRISQIAREQGWKLRRPRRVDKHDLTQRLLFMLDRQMMQLENTMTESQDQSAVLGKLAATLDRLIALDKATIRTPARRAESKVMQDIRQKVAERLEHFGL